MPVVMTCHLVLITEQFPPCRDTNEATYEALDAQLFSAHWTARKLGELIFVDFSEILLWFLQCSETRAWAPPDFFLALPVARNFSHRLTGFPIRCISSIFSLVISLHCNYWLRLCIPENSLCTLLRSRHFVLCHYCPTCDRWIKYKQWKQQFLSFSLF